MTASGLTVTRRAIGDVCVLLYRAQRSGNDGKCRVLSKYLVVRQLVGDLDLEPILALREAGKRNDETSGQLMTHRHVELGWQRLGIQRLRRRLVEVLLPFGGL